MGVRCRYSSRAR